MKTAKKIDQAVDKDAEKVVAKADNAVDAMKTKKVQWKKLDDKQAEGFC